MRGSRHREAGAPTWATWNQGRRWPQWWGGRYTGAGAAPGATWPQDGRWPEGGVTTPREKLPHARGGRRRGYRPCVMDAAAGGGVGAGEEGPPQGGVAATEEWLPSGNRLPQVKNARRSGAAAAPGWWPAGGCRVRGVGGGGCRRRTVGDDRRQGGAAWGLPPLQGGRRQGGAASEGGEEEGASCAWVCAWSMEELPASSHLPLPRSTNVPDPVATFDSGCFFLMYGPCDSELEYLRRLSRQTSWGSVPVALSILVPHRAYSRQTHPPPPPLAT